MTSRFSQRIVLNTALVLGLVLAVMPMSHGLQAWRPEWALMITLYWVMAAPNRVNIGTCFIIGLCTDVLLGSTLGIYAAAMAFVGYIFATHYKRIRNFSLTQQALFVGLMVMIVRAIVYLLEYYINNASLQSNYFLPAVSSAIIWPWLFLVLRKVRRRFGVV